MESTQNPEHDEIVFLRSELAIAERSSQRNANAHMAAEAEARQARVALSQLREHAEALVRFIEATECFKDDGFPVKPAARREGMVRVENLWIVLATVNPS